MHDQQHMSTIKPPWSTDVNVDRVYERRPKASMPASCNHFTMY